MDMAKNRELAQVMYASTLGRASASRIWRTVVVAGAMLGAPVAVHADTKAPAKPAETKPAESKPAPPPPDAPPPEVSKTDAAKAAKEAVKAVQAEIKTNDKALADGKTALKKAKTDADKATAQTSVDDATKHQAELKDKLAAAQAESKKANDELAAENAKKRPRTTVQKPMGRGFILS
jgi:hypothetical protein